MINPEPVPPASAFAPVAGESITAVPERFLERRGEYILDPLSFADDCQAFAFVTRFGQCTHERTPYPPRITTGAISARLCALRSAVKTWPPPNTLNHQHNRLEPAMKANNSQAHTEHQRLAMIPFVQNRPFQNRVSKRHKKYQKVTKSPIRPFHRLDILGFVVGFLSGPDTGHLAVKTGS